MKIAKSPATFCNMKCSGNPATHNAQPDCSGFPPMKALQVGGRVVAPAISRSRINHIVESVIRPTLPGMNPLGRDVNWRKTSNLLRNHGQKGMLLSALSGVGIARSDISGNVANMLQHSLIGGAIVTGSRYMDMR